MLSPSKDDEIASGAWLCSFCGSPNKQRVSVCGKCTFSRKTGHVSAPSSSVPFTPPLFFIEPPLLSPSAHSLHKAPLLASSLEAFCAVVESHLTFATAYEG